MKPKNILTAAILAATGLALTSTSAHAQNPGYTPGDLFIGFQATGASTTNSYVLARLGQAGILRDAVTNQTNLVLGLGAALTTEFGANWFNRTDLYVGAIAIGSNDEFDGTWGAGGPGVNGDWFNTPYVSASRTTKGTEGTPTTTAWSLAPGAIGDAANGGFAAGDRFETLGSGAIFTYAKGLNFVDWDDQNPISAGVQGAAMGGVFSGGIQQAFTASNFGTFGDVTQAEALLDIYRLPGGDVNGVSQAVNVMGSFEGTIAIDNTGRVDLVLQPIPEPAAAGMFAAGSLLVGCLRRSRRRVASVNA